MCCSLSRISSCCGVSKTMVSISVALRKFCMQLLWPAVKLKVLAAGILKVLIDKKLLGIWI